MINRKIGDLDVSAVGLGTWAIGGGEWWGNSDEEKSIETIVTAVESGISLIDTAPCYGFGASEIIVGKALKGIRDKVILSTKCGLWWHDERGSEFFRQAGHIMNRCLDPDTIKTEIELSLKRLDTDYIDVYFTHWQSVEPYVTPIEKTMKCLEDLRSQGLIKAIGASNVSKEDIAEYSKFGKLDVIQEKYSMLDRVIEDTLVPSCDNIAVMAYSPLEQGLLTGKIGMDYTPTDTEYRSTLPWYKPENRIKVINMLKEFEPITSKHNCTLAQLVTAWCIYQKGITHVLCGARKPEHILDTVKAADIKLTAEELEFMRNAVLEVGMPV